jgi:hypothetical protein
MSGVGVDPEQPTPVSGGVAAAHTADPCSDSAPLASLLTLTRRGAYLRPAPGGAEIFSPRNNFVAPVSRLDHKAFAEAVAAGWLRKSAEKHWQLSERGVAAVRWARSVSTATAPGPKTRKATPQSRGQAPLRA